MYFEHMKWHEHWHEHWHEWHEWHEHCSIRRKKRKGCILACNLPNAAYPMKIVIYMIVHTDHLGTR